MDKSKAPVGATPTKLNKMAAAAASVPLPSTAVKAAPSTPARPSALPTPLRKSINARLARTPAAKSAMKTKKALPTPLRQAIMSRKAGDLNTVRNAAIDFVSDRLMVESFSREVEGIVEVARPVALECALDAYADNVTVTNTNNDGLVVNTETDAMPFRALPADLRNR